MKAVFSRELNFLLLKKCILKASNDFRFTSVLDQSDGSVAVAGQVSYLPTFTEPCTIQRGIFNCSNSRVVGLVSRDRQILVESGK